MDRVVVYRDTYRDWLARKLAGETRDTMLAGLIALYGYGEQEVEIAIRSAESTAATLEKFAVILSESTAGLRSLCATYQDRPSVRGALVGLIDDVVQVCVERLRNAAVTLGMP